MMKRDAIHRKTKIVIIILSALLIIFVFLNAAWFIWKDARYGSYTDKMEKAISSSFLVPRYTYSDDEGFTYSVKYPDYLSTTGNLSLAAPTDALNALLIWVGVNEGYEYGVLITDEVGQYQIYVDEEGNAIYEEDAEIIDQNRALVNLLFSKANVFWDLN